MATSGQHWEPRIVRGGNTFPPSLLTRRPSLSASLIRTRASLATTPWLTQALNSVPDLVMILNRDRQVVYANHAAGAFTSTADWKGATCLGPGDLFDCCHAQSAPGGCGTSEACHLCGAFRSVLEALEGRRASHECRILRLRPGAEAPLNLRVWAAPFDWHGERLILLFAGDTDSVSRRHTLERIFFRDLQREEPRGH